MSGRRYYFVYLLTNSTRKTIYTGVTCDLKLRVAQPRAGRASGFTRRYGATNPVWFEVYEDPVQAIQREKQLKAGPHRQRTALIEALNPEWRDLWEEV